jgi:8-oxo-dGTP pyrophosphatase MutT (NUDIX family)
MTIDDNPLYDDDLPAIITTTQSLISHFTNNHHKPTYTLFNPDRLTRSEAYGSSCVPAAVLIPIIETDNQLRVLFTLRSENLNKHAGQISFPGGRVDESDTDAIAAALRESAEEIGLQSHYVNVLGSLNPYITSTGFNVTPVVALVKNRFVPECNQNEVSTTLTVPLHFLMNPANYELQTREEQNQQRSFYSITYENNLIWGATAAILFGLYETLLSSHQPD